MKGLRAATLPLLLATVTSVGCRRSEAVENKAAEKRVHVQTAVVATKSVPTTITVTGVLEAAERTDLSANASGRVTRTFVELGDHVKEGALLVQLDSRAASLSQAEADANASAVSQQLVSIRADCARSKALLAKGAITQQEFDRANAQCLTEAASEEAARARAAAAAQNVHDAGIRAPFTGVVAERFVQVGDYVHPDSKVVTLLVDDPLRLRLSLPESSIAAARADLEVTFDTLARPGKTFHATLKFLGREVRPTTRDLIVEGVASNRDGALMPGMFVTAHLPTGETTLPAVPRSALVPVDLSPTVFVVVDKHLQQRAVQTGNSSGDMVGIVDGVAIGDQVVIDPSETTIDGARVE